jgi:hypothetical protein
LSDVDAIAAGVDVGTEEIASEDTLDASIEKIGGNLIIGCGGCHHRCSSFE